MRFKGITPAALQPAPIPSPRILTDSRKTDQEVATAIRMAEAESNLANAVLDETREETYIPANPDNITGTSKLSRLVDDDFPFDPSQLIAIEGVVGEQYSCITGAAGTGKTTVTKKAVDRLKEGLGEVDMTGYFKKLTPGTSAYDDEMDRRAALADDDDYVMPDHAIPSIAMVGFTGRSTQMIKKNFPRDWHSNIMTIHRLLAFAPEFYEDWDEESGDMVNKMRFTPTYNANLLLPWDVIIIDEAGMVSLDLWRQLWAACKPGVRIIMIGDINQLPPVHGRSIFGFALAAWPSFELTHIHRQKTVDADGNVLEVKNSIVESAWAILQGYRPKSDIPNLTLGDSTNSNASKQSIITTLQTLVRNKTWKFVMIAIPEDADVASQRIRKTMQLLNGKLYDPMRDSIITAINGHDGSRGMNLGQIPMNRELALVLNPSDARMIIDGGRERKQFAVGDKVMATKNDYEAGITNGMTGIIKEINRNAGYAGDPHRFGLIADVNAYFAENPEDDPEDFSLEDMSDAFEAQAKGKEAAKEGRDRGPASHIIVVTFGEGEHAFDIAFGSLSEVASLQMAYTVTCHKMQGGESPLCATIIHQSHKSMLFREWGYTADTRASERQIFFYTDLGLRVMLNKQKIVGKTLKEKIRSFQALTEGEGINKGINVNLPKAMSRNDGRSNLLLEKNANVEQVVGKALARLNEIIPTNAKVEPETTALDALVGRQFNMRVVKEPTDFEEIGDRIIYRDRVVYVDRGDEQHREPVTQPADVWGGELRKHVEALIDWSKNPPAMLALANAQLRLMGPPLPKLLTYQPLPQPAAPIPDPAPSIPAAPIRKRFGVKS